MTGLPEVRPLESLYIFGAGGFGREAAWLAQVIHGPALHVTFLVDDPRYLSAPVNGCAVELVRDVDPDRAPFVAAVGDVELKRKAVAACEAAGLDATALVHPRAEMSSRVTIAPGAIVCAGSVLTTEIAIEEHAHVHVNCTVGHDSVVGAFSTVAPGVHVAGNVLIRSGVFVGTGANIINGAAAEPLVVGEGAVIAAGACVVSSVEPGTLMAGVPAVPKRSS